MRPSPNRSRTSRRLSSCWRRMARSYQQPTGAAVKLPSRGSVSGAAAAAMAPHEARVRRRARHAMPLTRLNIRRPVHRRGLLCRVSASP
eukprot:4527205-Prymnesium_polylepis.1